jgi:hypothetical protein
MSDSETVRKSTLQQRDGATLREVDLFISEINEQGGVVMRKKMRPNVSMRSRAATERLA